jgi:hypothetical protein
MLRPNWVRNSPRRYDNHAPETISVSIVQGLWVKGASRSLLGLARPGTHRSENGAMVIRRRHLLDVTAAEWVFEKRPTVPRSLPPDPMAG